jgi:signal transduction histidine kinase
MRSPPFAASDISWQAMPEKARTAREITLFFTNGFAVVTLLLGVGAYFAALSIVREQLDLQLRAETGTLRAIAERGGTSALVNALGRRDDRGVNSFGYRLLDPQGRRIAGGLEIRAATAGESEIAFIDDDGAARPARALVTVLADGSRLTVAIELEPAERLRSRLVLLLAAALCLLLLIGLAGGALFGRAIRLRLEAINRIASGVTRGKLDMRVPVSARNDEFDQLSTTLNAMLDRNAALIVNIRRISSDIAHELRTPIMRLRLRMEQALQRATENSSEAAIAERSIADIDAILALFSALLRIAEIEAGGLQSYFRRMNLSAIVEPLADSYALVAEDDGREMIVSIQPDAYVHGDRDLLAQVAVNLFENALRHTAPGTRINITLKCADSVTLVVADDGPGIAPQDRARALRPFERLGTGVQGHGLGLNLVAAIVAAHDGTISLDDNRPGLAVTVTLPKAPDG